MKLKILVIPNRQTVFFQYVVEAKLGKLQILLTSFSEANKAILMILMVTWHEQSALFSIGRLIIILEYSGMWRYNCYRKCFVGPTSYDNQNVPNAHYFQTKPFFL